MHFETARSLAKAPLWPSALGHLYAVTGKREEALACVHEIQALSKHMYVEPSAAGLIYVALGDLPRWQKALAEAVNERVGQCITWGINPHFDSIRSEPFFKELCRRIGLP